MRGSWVNTAPKAARPYLRLSRFDRPIGFWLLALPCLAGLAFARIGDGLQPIDALHALLYAIGAVAMRGAGCTYNDILDQDIDAKVERTAARPLPAGAVSLRQAWVWLLVQCLVGLGVLLLLPMAARWVALAAIPLVALYPLMKRITWWPQAWLGLTLNWGVLVAAAAVRETLVPGDFILFVGLALWTLGYDTIYAAQDREDDALVGVRSTARRFGGRIRTGVWLAYGAAVAAIGAACLVNGGLATALLSLPFAAHLGMQAWRFQPENNARSLRLFRANRDGAILLVIGFAIAAQVI